MAIYVFLGASVFFSFSFFQKKIGNNIFKRVNLTFFSNLKKKESSNF
jgi:hypothetical protein